MIWNFVVNELNYIWKFDLNNIEIYKNQNLDIYQLPQLILYSFVDLSSKFSDIQIFDTDILILIPNLSNIELLLKNDIIKFKKKILKKYYKDDKIIIELRAITIAILENLYKNFSMKYTKSEFLHLLRNLNNNSKTEINIIGNNFF